MHPHRQYLCEMPAEGGDMGEGGIGFQAHPQVDETLGGIKAKLFIGFEGHSKNNSTTCPTILEIQITAPKFCADSGWNSKLRDIIKTG